MIHPERWAYSKSGIASQHDFTRLRSLTSLEGRFNVTLVKSHVSSVSTCIGVQLLASRRRQHEWVKKCLFVSDSGSSNVVHCVLSVRNLCFLSEGNFWIQLFFPDCHIQSGKKCWEPICGIVRLMKIASCTLDSILGLHRSHWSHFRNELLQLLDRSCLGTIFCLDFFSCALDIIEICASFETNSSLRQSDVLLNTCLCAQTILEPPMSFMPQRFAKSWLQKLTW